MDGDCCRAVGCAGHARKIKARKACHARKRGHRSLSPTSSKLRKNRQASPCRHIGSEPDPVLVTPFLYPERSCGAFQLRVLSLPRDVVGRGVGSGSMKTPPGNPGGVAIHRLTSYGSIVGHSVTMIRALSARSRRLVLRGILPRNSFPENRSMSST